MSVSRSIVLPVCGTRLNTRRSPSVMMLLATGWRWPGTAETPVMRWEHIANQNITPTVRGSVQETGTTTALQITVQPINPMAGGTIVAQDQYSLKIRLPSGQPFLQVQDQEMSRPVACWSKSTKYIRKCIDSWGHLLKLTLTDVHTLININVQNCSLYIR